MHERRMISINSQGFVSLQGMFAGDVCGVCVCVCVCGWVGGWAGDGCVCVCVCVCVCGEARVCPPLNACC